MRDTALLQRAGSHGRWREILSWIMACFLGKKVTGTNWHHLVVNSLLKLEDVLPLEQSSTGAYLADRQQRYRDCLLQDIARLGARALGNTRGISMWEVCTSARILRDSLLASTACDHDSSCVSACREGRDCFSSDIAGLELIHRGSVWDAEGSTSSAANWSVEECFCTSVWEANRGTPSAPRKSGLEVRTWASPHNCEGCHFIQRPPTCIIESQNPIGWKRPLRSSSPTVNLTLPRPPLYHVSKHLIQMSFKYLQGWRLNHFPGQPVPMLDNLLGEEKFPNIQSKPPLVQLEAISSCPITCYLGEETDPHLSTTSFQAVVESNKVSPQPPFLQAEQPQLPQLLLIRLLLQTLHQLRCPSRDTLQHLNVSLVVGGPKLNTVFEGHDHFPTPAGHAIFDTSQDAIGFPGHLGTLLAHIQAAVNQHPQVLLCQAAFQPLFPKPVALHGVAVAQVQDLALGLVKPHTIDLGPSIQPVQVPLQSLPTLKQINTPTQLGVICKLTEGALDPFVQIIDKDVKQDWPQHRALGNTACDQPPTGVNSIHHHSLGPAIQPVLYPVKSTPVQAMSSLFLQENAVGNCVKGFTEV
ncbi:hypothetical protein QYF61_000670 [Mycteria americana]|uniref:Uncharacterized protein n=1 Tax=Mycteria americana TaxID=33587 RepID=A0AAN7RV95_MYCAM|nr:hypothetical protein QYF61_000670 [Mycteria americana]